MRHDFSYVPELTSRRKSSPSKKRGIGDLANQATLLSKEQWKGLYTRQALNSDQTTSGNIRHRGVLNGDSERLWKSRGRECQISTRVINTSNNTIPKTVRRGDL